MWTWYQSSYWKFPAIVQEMLPEQHNVLLLITCSSQRGENFHKPYPSRVLALSMRISQGHLFLLYFLEGPSKGIHTFPKMPSTDWGPCPCSGIGQRNRYPPVVHPTTDCHAYCCSAFPLSCPSRAVLYLKGLEELEFGKFCITRITADGTERGICMVSLQLNSRVSSWTAGDGWHGQKAAHENRSSIKHMAKKNIGKHTWNLHRLMLSCTFSAS